MNPPSSKGNIRTLKWVPPYMLVGMTQESFQRSLIAQLPDKSILVDLHLYRQKWFSDR